MIDRLSFSAGEKRLADSFLRSLQPEQGAILDGIHPADEIYLYLKEHLRKGHLSAFIYYASAHDIVQSIANVVRSSGKTMSALDSFLDFASGYGRATRLLREKLNPAKLWVSDIYTGAVDFQRAYFGVNGFYSQPRASDVRFPRTFEVIHVGSLFSHLPMNRFEEWLRTLYGNLAENGLLLFTTHGHGMHPPEVPRDPSGFTFLPQSESRSLSTNEYGVSFVSTEWVENLCRRMDVGALYCLSKEWSGAQDLYIAARSEVPSLAAINNTISPQGYIDFAGSPRPGTVSIRGWALDHELGAPIERVSLYQDGQLIANARLGLPLPGVSQHFNLPNCVNCGWGFESDEQSLVDDSQRLSESIFVKLESKRAFTRYLVVDKPVHST